MPLPELVTTAQAAERLKVSPRTIARWADSGRLPVMHRLPGETGAILFSPVDVERIAAELIAAAPAAAGAGGES